MMKHRKRKCTTHINTAFLTAEQNCFVVVYPVQTVLVSSHFFLQMQTAHNLPDRHVDSDSQAINPYLILIQVEIEIGFLLCDFCIFQIQNAIEPICCDHIVFIGLQNYAQAIWKVFVVGH